MIDILHVTKIFNRGETNDVKALDTISLNIVKGQFLVIVGPNGSGKTTLLNIISGAEKCTDGKIVFNNTDVTSMPEYYRSRWVARVFQNPLSGTAPDLSILDNFRLAALRTKPKYPVIGINKSFKEKVQSVIATLKMGLENKIEQPIGTLSGGQRQALTLLMTMMDETLILLLDEPSAALDPKSADLVMDLADKLIKEKKLTALLVTHNLKEALQYGNRLIQMGEGKIIKDIGDEEKSKLRLQDMVDWF